MLRATSLVAPVAVLTGLLSFPVLAQDGDAPPPAEEKAPTLVFHMVVEDSGAQDVADKTAKALRDAARAKGWIAVSSPDVVRLLDAATDDLVSASQYTRSGRQLVQEGLEHYAYVRLDSAAKALEDARRELMAAQASPSMEDLLTVHLYLGVVKLYQRDPAMREELRRALFIKPNLRPNLPPRVLQTIARARATIGASSGALRIEGAPENADVYVDGFPRGSADRPIVGLSQGMHYVWVQAKGYQSFFGEISIPSEGDAVLRVQLEPVRQSVREALVQGDGDRGAAAIANLLGAKRFALVEARSTVTGRFPFAMRARVFDAASERRFVSERLSIPSDEEQASARLAAFAESLITKGPGESGASPATIGAALNYFPAVGSTHVSFTYSFDLATQYYDGESKLVNPQDTSYVFTQHGLTIGLRYALREDIALVVDAPFYYQSIDWEPWDCTGTGLEDDVTRTNSGFGDIRVGTNYRIRAAERGAFSVVLSTLTLKLPTGGDHAGSLSCRVDNTLTGNRTKSMLGTGQTDIDLSFTGALGTGSLRSTFTLGYMLRMPGKVSYIFSDDTGVPGKINFGDELHASATAALFVSRWLAPELGIVAWRRNPSPETRGQARSSFRAPSVGMVQARAGLILDFTERVQAHARIHYPIYGVNTDRFFPFDVTGPQATLGLRIAY